MKAHKRSNLNQSIPSSVLRERLFNAFILPQKDFNFLRNLYTFLGDDKMDKLNESVAELIGMHVGDGTLYRTSRGIVWELRGSLEEKEYYLNTVKPLLETIFGTIFEPKFRSGGKSGCFGIQTSNKAVTNFFIHHGFLPGTKTYTVRIPEYILTSSTSVKLGFLRGLFDTDGCIRFDKINKQIRHTYPRVEFGFASRNLRDDLLTLLKNLGFRCFGWGNKKYDVCLAGCVQVGKWFEEVKPHNKKHLNKYKSWQEVGYYPARVA